MSSLHEQVALFHLLPGFKGDLGDDAREIGAHRHAVDGLQRPDRAEHRLPRLRLHDDRRHRARRRSKLGAFSDRLVNDDYFQNAIPATNSITSISINIIRFHIRVSIRQFPPTLGSPWQREVLGRDLAEPSSAAGPIASAQFR